MHSSGDPRRFRCPAKGTAHRLYERVTSGLCALACHWLLQRNKDTVSGGVDDLRIMNLYVMDTGLFKLDGGAMFGVVPKSLWGKVPS